MPSAPPSCSLVLIIPAAWPWSSSSTAVRPVGSLTVRTMPSPSPCRTSPGKALGATLAEPEDDRPDRHREQRRARQVEPAAGLGPAGQVRRVAKGQAGRRDGQRDVQGEDEAPVDGRQEAAEHRSERGEEGRPPASTPSAVPRRSPGRPTRRSPPPSASSVPPRIPGRRTRRSSTACPARVRRRSSRSQRPPRPRGRRGAARAGRRGRRRGP